MSDIDACSEHSTPSELDAAAIKSSWQTQRVALVPEDPSADSDYVAEDRDTSSGDIEVLDGLGRSCRSSNDEGNRSARGGNEGFERRYRGARGEQPEIDLSPGYTPGSIISRGDSPPGRGARSAGRERSYRSPMPPMSVPSTIQERRRHTGLSVRTEIMRVFNGTWYNKRATYVGLVTTPDDPSTVLYAKITAEVRSLDDKSSSCPQIVRFSPKQIFGEAKTIDETVSFELEGGVSAGGLPVGPSVSSKVGRSATTSRTVRRSVIGRTRPRPRESGRSIMEVESTYNEAQNEGIYSEIPMGFVVDHGEKPFSLTVEVKLKRSIMSSIFPLVAKPYAESRPALFDGKLDLLKPDDDKLGGSMQDWDTPTWQRLVDYPAEYKDIVCGE